MKKKILLIGAVAFSPLFCLASGKDPEPVKPGPMEAIIAFLPVVLYLLILLTVAIRLRKSTVGLSDLLAEKDLLPVPGSGATATNPPPQSASRFIALLTGLVGLTLGVCFSTFYLYCYFINPDKPADFSGLTTVLWGLGIGVLPYGFNKASSAMK